MNALLKAGFGFMVAAVVAALGVHLGWATGWHWPLVLVAVLASLLGIVCVTLGVDRGPSWPMRVVEDWSEVRTARVGSLFVGPIEKGEDHGRVWRVRERLTNGYVLVQTPVQWYTYVVPLSGDPERIAPEPQVRTAPATVLPWRAVN